ncbi:MAG: ABC transporter substrate-binding protein [Firmicutes bacterium]|nr:ABC transporter substrate-binding protein [Clostridiales bacterium]MBQ2747689.1 ABC transporter substrate-binding protein [Bacillota bacterium]MBQ9972827.1 ABC transporter substrate-binding protein [Bacillota bacterium]
MKAFKKIIAIALVMTMVFSLAACGGGGSTDGEVKDTLVFGSTWADATSLDPGIDSSSKSIYIYSSIYDPLFFYDDVEGVQNGIADSYEISEDGTEYTVHIRDNAYFHDGSKIMASDVVFSLLRATQSAAQVKYASNIADAQVVDDSTVKIILKNEFAPFIKYLSGIYIVSEKAITELGENYGKDAETVVGSGPYMLKEWKLGEYTLLEAFPEYYRGESPIKYVKVIGIVDASSMLIALETGDVDLTYNVSATDLELIENNPDLTLYTEETSHMFWFLLNNTTFPFNNKYLRQAVNYACNKEDILQAEKKGWGSLADTNFMLAPQSLGYTSNDAVANYPHDIEKAKECLELAGYPDGFEFTANALQGWGDNAAFALQENLKEVGITMNVELIEDAVSFNNIANLTYQMDVMGTNDRFLDADMLYDRYYTGSGNNQVGYSNPEVDKLLAAARIEQDPEKRTEIYDQAVAILKDDACIIPCYYETYFAASSSKLKGFDLKSNIHFQSLYGLYFEE